MIDSMCNTVKTNRSRNIQDAFIYLNLWRVTNSEKCKHKNKKSHNSNYEFLFKYICFINFSISLRLSDCRYYILTRTKVHYSFYV